MAYWEFYIKAGITHLKLFDDYLGFLSKGIFDVVFLKDYCFIAGCPKTVHRDARGRLHSLEGSAIEWQNDEEWFFIHGVAFQDKSTWRSIVSKEIPALSAIGLKNAEQRTVACQIIGYDTIIAELGAKKLNHVKRKCAGQKGKVLEYYLYEMDLKDDRNPARFLKVECPSTGKETLLRVHPDCKSVDAALAWTFRMNPSQYELEMET